MGELEKLGDGKGIAMCRESLGVIAIGRARQGTGADWRRLATEARNHLDRAKTTFHALGDVVWIARTEWALGQADGLDGDPEGAAAHLALAAATLAELGAVPPGSYESWQRHDEPAS